MTDVHPPRLAVWLLRRFAADDEPLAGDLVEMFALRRSRFWFWRQVAGIIAFRAGRQRDEDHPLGLAAPSIAAAPPRPLRPPRPINLAASPLPGIGGLGLVTLGAVVAVMEGQSWWISIPIALGGLVLGLGLVLLRRLTAHSAPEAARMLLRHSADRPSLGR